MANNEAQQRSEYPLKCLLHQSPQGVTDGQRVFLSFSIFLKGGLLGAFIPFSSLWMSRKGYNSHDLALVSCVDAFATFLLPLIGGSLDGFRAHNAGFVALLLILAALKCCYLLVPQSLVCIMALTALTTPLIRAANSVLDCMALYTFVEKGYFARLRLWGDLGFGCVGLGVGIALQVFRSEDVIFIIFACLCGVLAIVWAVGANFVSNVRPDSKGMSVSEFCTQVQELKHDLFMAGTVRVLAVVFLIGGSIGLVTTFELVLIDSMMGSGLLLGLCKFIGTVFAVPVWWFLPNIMDVIGIKNIQLICLACAATRLFVLGVVTNPWYTLISEMLAGLGGFAFMYGSITIVAGRSIKEDLKGTSQTIIFMMMASGAGLSPLVLTYLLPSQHVQTIFLFSSSFVATIFIGLLLYDLTEKFLFGTYSKLEDSLKRLP